MPGIRAPSSGKPMVDLWLAELERMSGGVCARSHEAGEIIFAPQVDPDNVFLLVVGAIRLFRISADGRELCTRYVGPSEIFGEEGALRGVMRKEFAEAVSPSRTVSLRVEVFRQILIAQPTLALQVATQLDRHLGRIKDRMESMIVADAVGRVARGLLELAEGFGKHDRSGPGIAIDIPLTQEELANFVGTSRQTVNATLRRFEEEGLTAREHRRIVVLNREQLVRAACSGSERAFSSRSRSHSLRRASTLESIPRLAAGYVHP